MTGRKKEFVGTFEVKYADGSDVEVSVYREEEQVLFRWPNHGGVRNEQVVREMNTGGLEGWIRELPYALPKRIKSYGFVPPRR